MPRQTRASRQRRYLAFCKMDNQRQNRRSSIADLRFGVQQRLMLEHPELSPIEIEERVARIMQHGLKPTTDETDRMRAQRAREGGHLKAR